MAQTQSFDEWFHAFFEVEQCTGGARCLSEDELREWNEIQAHDAWISEQMAEQEHFQREWAQEQAYDAWMSEQQATFLR